MNREITLTDEQMDSCFIDVVERRRREIITAQVMPQHWIIFNKKLEEEQAMKQIYERDRFSIKGY